MNWAAILWLVLMVVFLIAEASTVTLVSIWFAAGALAAMAVSLLGGALLIQVSVFLIVAALLLAALRPFVKKYVRPKISRTNIDSVIGSTGVVTEEINNTLAQGQVKLGAMYWSARSTSGSIIPTGTVIQVDRIEGVKVYVERVKEEK